MTFANMIPKYFCKFLDLVIALVTSLQLWCRAHLLGVSGAERLGGVVNTFLPPSPVAKMLLDLRDRPDDARSDHARPDHARPDCIGSALDGTDLEELVMCLVLSRETDMGEWMTAIEEATAAAQKRYHSELSAACREEIIHLSHRSSTLVVTTARRTVSLMASVPISAIGLVTTPPHLGVARWGNLQLPLFYGHAFFYHLPRGVVPFVKGFIGSLRLATVATFFPELKIIFDDPEPSEKAPPIDHREKFTEPPPSKVLAPGTLTGWWESTFSRR